MNTQLSTIFNYNNRTIRTAGTPESPLFCAKDVCDILELGNSRQALARLDDDEKGVILNDTPGGTQQMQAVTEPGLYKLISSSRKPEAKAFLRWVAHEVLPSIRKTGQYSVNKTPAELLLEQVQMLVEQEKRQRALEVHAVTVDHRLEQLEAHQQSGSGFVTVRGFCNLQGLRCSNEMAARIGKRAAHLARCAGVTLRCTADETWGSVKVYPEEFVEQAALEFGLLEPVPL